MTRTRIQAAADPSPGDRAENAFFENAFSKNAFFEHFANFWRARSRLYQNEILQQNMRLTAFSSSTRFASFCTAAISIFSQKIGLKNYEFRKISEKFRKLW